MPRTESRTGAPRRRQEGGTISETSSYGSYYWCVKVAKSLSKSGEIYLHAERVVLDHEAVMFLSNKDHPMLVVPAGSWSAFYAASVLDGSAVAVEHWEGEVVEKHSSAKKRS